MHPSTGEEDNVGIFGRQDELFEIMNKQVSRRRGPGTQTSVTSGPATRPSKLIGSSASPRLGSGFGRQDDLLEIDGDALVVIDDDEWNADASAAPDAPEEERESNGMVSLRLDTAAVGGVLLAGVVAVAFLLGRTSGGPTEPAQQVVEVAVTEETPAPSQVAAPAAAPTATTVPVSAGRVQATTVAGAPKPSPEPEAAAVSGDYELIVVSTTPEKAQAVAEWMNTNARSPIFGRTDLQAYARKGGVRIRGFAKREGDVERRVRATSDPTNGGSGTFNDAYYVKSR